MLGLWKHRRRAVSSKACRRAARRRTLERLEPRTLLAADIAVSWNDGLATVDGTDANDVIVISRVGDEIIFSGSSFSLPNDAASMPVSVFETSEGFRGFIVRSGGGDDIVMNNTIYPLEIYGEDGADFLIGGDAGEQIHGGPGNDFIEGGLGNDILRGGPGLDNLHGGNDGHADQVYGNDFRLVIGGGFDPRDGHADVLRDEDESQLFDSLGEDITGNGAPNAANGNYTGHSFGFQEASWNDGVLTLRNPTEGNTIVIAQSGGRVFIPGYGSPNGYLVTDLRQVIVFATTGDDRIVNTLDVRTNMNGLEGHDVIYGGPAGDLLNGDDGNDLLYGLAGGDMMGGGFGEDQLFGGPGQDFLYGEDGHDLVNGGPDEDAVSYFFAPRRMLVYLNDHVAFGDGTDSLFEIENVHGSSFDDVIYGDNADNELNGETGADQLFGGAGNDLLRGSPGDDVLDGQEGADGVTHKFAAAGVNVDLALGTSTGGNGNDRLASIENVIGSDFSDVIWGDAEHNVLVGGGSTDILAGWGGDDTINGGEGYDFLYGHEGYDLLVDCTGQDLIDLGTDGGHHDSGSLDDDVAAAEAVSVEGHDNVLRQVGSPLTAARAAYEPTAAVPRSASDAFIEERMRRSGAQFLNDGYEIRGNGQRLFIWGTIQNDQIDVQRLPFTNELKISWRNGSGTPLRDEVLSFHGSLIVIAGWRGDDVIHPDVNVNAVFAIYGGSGNDTLWGGSRRDYLYGETDNDTLYGVGDLDVLAGRQGRDVFYNRSRPRDWHDFTPYDQHLHTRHGSGVRTGTASSRGIVASNVSRSIVATASVGSESFIEDITYDVTDGVLTITGSDSDDQITLLAPEGEAHFLVRTQQGNMLVAYADVNRLAIHAGRGNDAVDLTGLPTSIRTHVYGQAGNDTLVGDPGHIVLFGGQGLDTRNGVIENDTPPLVTSPGPGGAPTVRALDPLSGEERFSVSAYDPRFTGGVRVATGDINGDGAVDIITAPGPGGGPHVRVFDGLTGEPIPGLIGSFYGYDPLFSGGVFVASGDLNSDGLDDVVTAAGAGGGPHVRVFSGADGAELFGFYAYSPFFSGGVSVAVADVNGDGRDDIITGAGPGGGPHVRVFSGIDGTELMGMYAYHPLFGGGVSVAAGDVDADGKADIITGAGPGGGPHVRVFSGDHGSELFGFYGYHPFFSGGVQVAAVDANGDGRADIITAPGAGGGPHIRVFDGVTQRELLGLYAYDSHFGGGVFVAGAAIPPADVAILGPSSPPTAEASPSSTRLEFAEDPASDIVATVLLEDESDSLLVPDSPELLHSTDAVFSADEDVVPPWIDADLAEWLPQLRATMN